MAKGSLRVNGIIVDADGELKASTGDSIVIREDDGSAVITVDTSGNVLIGGPTTVGVDDSGHDVKFFGATSGKYMLWDESADSLIVDGKVGIGTSAPAVPLHVNNSTSSACRLYLQNTGNTSAGYTQIWSQNNDLAFNAGNSERMRIDSNGKVGIGTTTTTDAGVTITPSVARDGAWDAKLALQSTGATDYPALIFSGCSATNRFGAIVQTASTSGADSNQITAEINFQNTSTTAGDIVFRTNDNVGTGAPVERMRIDSAGQVTFSTAPTGFNYVATVTAAQTNSTDGIVIANSGTAAAGVTVAHADTTNQASVNNSGRTYIQDITLDTYGHITGITSATETVTDTTYSVASGTALGLVQIGYTENAKNYPVELGSGTNANKMFVNVPWTDNNTTYSVADSSTLGLIKIGYSQTGKNYPVQLSSEQAYVNVPWTDTDTTYSVASPYTNGLMSSSDKSKVDNMGLVYLDSITFSGNQSDSFDLNSHTSYTNFYITMTSVRVGSAGGYISIRSATTANNQSDQKGRVTTYYSSMSGTPFYDDDTGTTSGMLLLRYVSSTSGEGTSGSFTLFGPRDSSIRTQLSGIFSGSYGQNLVVQQGGGVKTNASNDRYLSFMGYSSTMSSSTMLAGTARLYGIK